MTRRFWGHGLMIVVGAVGLVFSFVGKAAQQPQQISPNLSRPLHDAKTAVDAKKWSEAITKLREAEAIGGKTPYDQHVIDDLLSYAYINNENYVEAAKVLEREVDDGITAESEKPQKIRAIAEMNYQLRNYDKVIQFGNRALKSGDDERIRTLVGQAYYLKGDFVGARAFEEAAIDGEIEVGQTPKTEALMLLYSACMRIKASCTEKAKAELQRFHPEVGPWAVPMPERRDSPSRAENLTDSEAREIQGVMSELVPGSILNIGTVVVGCPCEDGSSCSDQVWVVGHQPVKTTALMLSKIDSRWTIGPVQRWWLDSQELQTRSVHLSSKEYAEAATALNKRTPRCVAGRPSPQR